MSEARKGMLLVISGASGTGKGTVIKELMAHDDSLVFSVSATTRSPRPGEENGREYYFISEEEFARRVENDEFIEYAPVFAHHYGTLRSEVSRRLAQGQNVVLDIDVQGAEQVIAREKDCVSIFILPPSMSELHRRLEGRGTESPEQIAMRQKIAVREIALKNHYRYNVINDDVAPALRGLQASSRRSATTRRATPSKSRSKVSYKSVSCRNCG